MAAKVLVAGASHGHDAGAVFERPWTRRLPFSRSSPAKRAHQRAAPIESVTVISVCGPSMA